MKRWLCTFLLLATVSANGEGFRINNQGVKATGMGGYEAALARDASTVYFNPAAMVRLGHNKLTAGANVIFPRISYLNPFDGNVDMDPAISLPFNIYGVTRLNSRTSFGVGIYTPFGENIVWDENWSGRFVTIENRFRSLFIQPVLSYSLNDKIAIGGGPIFGWSAMKRRFALDVSSTSASNGFAEYKNAGTGIGYTAAMHFQFLKLSAGITYHSAVKLKMKNGDATFSDVSAGGAILEGIPPSSAFNTNVHSPASLDAGLAYDIDNKIQLSLNVSNTFWSVLDESVVEFTDHDNLNFTEQYKYEDAFSFSLGANYTYTEKTVFRAGIGLTKSHVPDNYLNPAHPDADQFIYSAGITCLANSGLSFDFSIMVRDYKSRLETGNIPYNFNGNYKNTLYIAGIGVNYEF